MIKDDDIIRSATLRKDAVSGIIRNVSAEGNDPAGVVHLHIVPLAISRDAVLDPHGGLRDISANGGTSSGIVAIIFEGATGHVDDQQKRGVGILNIEGAAAQPGSRPLGVAGESGVADEALVGREDGNFAATLSVI